MSTRRFCDICESEIPSEQSHAGTFNGETTLRSKARGVHQMQAAVKVEEIERPSADICRGCVFKALRQMDPTPGEGAGR